MATSIEYATAKIAKIKAESVMEPFFEHVTVKGAVITYCCSKDAAFKAVCQAHGEVCQRET